MKKRLCLIGLEREVSTRIAQNFDGNVLIHDMLPNFILTPNGDLYIERSMGTGFLKVDMVVYHGIFENDFEFLTPEFNFVSSLKLVLSAHSGRTST